MRVGSRQRCGWKNTEPGAVATGFMMEWLSALVIEVVQVLVSHREAIQYEHVGPISRRLQGWDLIHHLLALLN